VKRSIQIAVLVLFVLAVAATVVWFIWLPSYRPQLEPGERYGIDVSHHQGRIEWSRVAADGISFAYIKATEGGDFVDPRFRENWDAAGAAGLARGAYHFFSLCTPGQVQARNFLTIVPADVDGLPPAVDLELSGNCAGRPDRTHLRRELEDFLRSVEEETRQTVIVYLGDDFESRYGLRAVLRRPLWHLRFLRRPDVDGWVIWQVMGFARIDGIKGRVDLNMGRGPLGSRDGPS
jgi:lysozyme